MLDREYIGKKLRLDLDSMAEEHYIYTEFDIEGAGHSITIKAEDKEKFLDAYAAEWRKKAEKNLETVNDEEYDD